MKRKYGVEWIDIHKVKPYENNPRYNEDAVQAVANSITQFGFKVPIIIDKDYVIIAGHTRHKASELLGLEQIPCIVADDLSDQQVKAFRIADNKVAEAAGWDFEKLRVELECITEIDMSDFGINLEDLDINDSDFDHLFTDQEPKKKEPKVITCPHCGEVINL